MTRDLVVAPWLLGLKVSVRRGDEYVVGEDVGAACERCGYVPSSAATSWCPLCLTPRVRHWERARRRDEALTSRASVSEHRRSRLERGVFSFGPAGRLLLSIVPGLIIAEIAAGLWNTRRSPVIAFYVGLGLPVALLCVWFLTRVWASQPVERKR